MADRQGVLIRVGIDSSAGAWNAPVDPDTLEFVYIPIPEQTNEFHPGMRRPYTEVEPSLRAFCESRTVRTGKAQLPADLDGRCMHLDPDFEHLTYGDLGPRRGKPLRKLRENDLIVFYASLKPCREPHKLIYALVGMYLVDRVAEITDVERSLWAQNAHTRKLVHGKSDVIVWGKPEGSGRFRAAIPFGAYRDRAYRIRPDVLKAWGGISANDGYIQRSGALPRLNDAERCLRWIQSHDVELERRNF